MSDQQPPYPPPPPHQPQPPYGYYPQAPTPSSATTALVLGIVGLVVCPLVAIGAIIVGRNSMREIDESRGALGGRSTAKAGLVLGIIGIAWPVFGALLVLMVFSVGGVAGG